MTGERAAAGGGTRLSGTLVVMARAPVAGRTKTRLIPALGAERAAALSRAMLEDLLERFATFAVLETVLALDAPDAWSPRGGPEPRRVIGQGAGDLGERMLRLWRKLAPPVVFIGSDCPMLAPSDVLAACERLADADLALKPALDGGYVLGAFGADPEPVLAGVPWSTGSVLAATLERARRSRLRAALLPPSFDVDAEEDLRRLRYHLATLAGSPSCPRRTAALLAALGPPGAAP